MFGLLGLAVFPSPLIMFFSDSFRFCTQPVSIVSLMRPAKSHIFLSSFLGNKMEARVWVMLTQPKAS